MVSTSQRALLVVEALVGLAVVAALVGRTYGAFPTLAFVLCAVAVAYTGWVATRMVSALNDPTLEVTGRVRDYPREKLEGEKRLLLQGIKDLEADYATGKMTEAEYGRLRGTAEARAVEIIAALRESDERWAREAEKLVAKRLGPLERAGERAMGESGAPGARVESVPVGAAEAASEGGARPQAPNGAVAAADARLFDERPAAFRADESVLACSSCGTANDADARYCAGCGRPRQLEEAA